MLEAERNPWPGYSEEFRRIGAFEDGVMLLKGTVSFDATVGTRRFGVLSKVNAQGQVSTFADNLPFAAFPGGGTAEYFSNLVQVGNSVVLTRYSFPAFYSRQSPDEFRSCCGQELLRVDDRGQTTQLMDLSSFPLMSEFWLPEDSGSKLIGQGQEYYFLANTRGAGLSLLKANLSQGLSVVLDSRVLQEQNGSDFVPIQDIDLEGSPGSGEQGSHLVALLGRSRLLGDGEDSWRSGLVRVTGSGSLSPIFRIPQDLGLLPTKIGVEGAGFGLVACPEGFGPESYSCALYRVDPSGG